MPHPLPPASGLPFPQQRFPEADGPYSSPSFHQKQQEKAGIWH